jgi:YaiO family outer membrane protein
MSKLLWIIGGLLCPVLISMAQHRPSNFQWGAQSTYLYEALSGGRAPWQTGNLTLHLSHQQTTALSEWTFVQRFGRWDMAVALEGWTTLWPHAYGNARLQFSPAADFLPTHESYLELYQSIRAWELAMAFRYRHFSTQQVATWGLATGLYTGPWYLRTQALLTPLAGQLNWTQRFMVRRYGPSLLSFVEMQAGYGRGVEIIDVGPVLKRVRTYFVTARVQQLLTPNVGVTFTLSYSHDDLFTRRGVALGLLMRW